MRMRPKVTEEDVKDTLRLRDKLDRAYEEISNLHATTEALTKRATLLEGAPSAISRDDRNLLDALSLIGADNLLTSFKIGIPTATVLPPTASAFHNQTVRLQSDGQVYTFSEATRQWSGLQLVGDATLSANVALLNRDAQVFTGTYNKFAEVGIGVVPKNLLHVAKGTGSGATPTAALAQVAVENNGDAGVEIMTPNANIGRLIFSTPTSIDGAIVRWDQTNLTMTVGTGSVAGGKINLATGNFITAMTLDANRNVIVGTAALPTNATDGFFYIPSCAGPPTNVPTGFTGCVPMIYDSTNNNFYINSGGWKKVLLA